MYNQFASLLLATVMISSFSDAQAQTPEPTVNASNIVISNVGETSMTVSWTNGNGSSRIVICREADLLASTSPIDGTSYAHHNNYQLAPTLGSNKIVYCGSGSSFTMTGLKLNKPYRIGIMEYNGIGAGTNYFSAYAYGFQYTPGAVAEPTLSASGLTVEVVSVPEYAVKVSWTKGSGEGRVVMLREGQSVVSGLPQDGFVYLADDHLARAPWNGPNRIIYNGTGNSLILKGLSPTKWYGLSIVEYNGKGDPINYMTSGFLQGTIPAQPQAARDQQTILDNFSFQYRYDHRNRMVAKKVPGAAWVYMVYDSRDRLVLTQDGNQRTDANGGVTEKQWTFSKYDAFNRPILGGTLTADVVLTQSEMQQRVDNFYALPLQEGVAFFETFTGNTDGNVHGYSNNSYPRISDIGAYHSITYYDNYGFSALWEPFFTYETDNLHATVNDYPYDQPNQPNLAVIGQVTGTKIKVLDMAPSSAASWLKTVNYYDDKYRLIQTKAENYKGGVDRTSNLYDFTGKMLSTKTTYEEHHLTWTQIVGGTMFGGKMAKIGSSGWSNGALSAEMLPANTDGWIEFTAPDARYKIIGLTAINSSTVNNIDYSFFLQYTTGYIREGSTNIKSIPGGYQPGDVFRIARVGSEIRYFKNGVEIHRNTSATMAALYVDVSIYSNGSFIPNIRNSFSTSVLPIERRLAYDHAGRLLSVKHKVGEGKPVTWTGFSNTQVSGNDLVKRIDGDNTLWNGAAYSEESIPAGADGWLEFVAYETNKSRMIGLASSNLGSSGYASIDFAIFLSGDNVHIRESGSPVTYNVASITPNDIFRIERIGGRVFYKKNGLIVYTSTKTSSSELFADCSILHVGGRVAHAYLGQGFGTSEIEIAKNEYNELGQLVDKKLHRVGNTLERQSVDYRYNIRGWLTSMNNAALNNDNALNDDTGDFFGMQLSYNVIDPDLQNTEMYNGNISGIKWSNYPGTASVKQKGYTYEYDPMNRLKNSFYREKSTSWSALASSGLAETGFSYDLNGNILSLTRNDKRTQGTMDILTYNYGEGTPKHGNRLLKVADAGDGYKGFVDGANAAEEYFYDANGNMIRDLNKGIGRHGTDNINLITYNFLNLPQTVTKGGNQIQYIYDATGRKLSQYVRTGNTMKRTDYIGELVFENDALQFINHEEGRIVASREQLIYQNDGDNVLDAETANATVAEHTGTNGDKYLKVTFSGSTAVAKSGVGSLGGLFPVVAGERYRIRVKGYRTTNAAYLWVKLNGADAVWSGAALPALEGGEAFVEQVFDVPASAPASSVMEVGVVWGSSMTSGESFYINAFDIVRLEQGEPEYQYHLKDHLGNVRLTFTTRDEREQDTATMEPENVAAESANFDRYDKVRKVKYYAFDHTHDQKADTTGYAVRLSGGDDERYGLGRSISVMPGDRISAEVHAKYIDPAGDTTEALKEFLEHVGTLIGQGATSSGIVVDGSDFVNSTESFPFLDEDGQVAKSTSGTAPKAYLNWLVFDHNRTLILSKSGYKRLSATPKETGQDIDHERIYSPTITIDEPGYVYIYYSNEESTPLDVYFDDFKVTHTKSPVVQVDDYYAFGLTFNSYSRENSTAQDYKYNGKELQDELNLQWLDYGARMYDPAIARWMAVDPLADQMRRHSPYNYAFDNPIRFVDPDGMAPNECEGGDCNEGKKKEDEPKKEDEKGRNVKFEDLPKADNIEEFLKGAINFLQTGDKISGKDILSFINPDKNKEGEEQVFNILSKTENLEIVKSKDGKSIDMVVNTQGDKTIKETIDANGTDFTIKIKDGSSINLTNKGSDGVKIGLDNVGATYGIFPAPVSLLSATIQGNTLKLPLIKGKALVMPEQFKKK